MVAIVAERLKIRLDEDDPAFVLVELNRLALEETAAAVVDELSGFAPASAAAATSPRGALLHRLLGRRPGAWVACVLAASGALFALGALSGYWVSRAVAANDAIRADKVLHTAEGQAAVRLAELGQARILVNCEQRGWTLKDGYCYGTPSDGRVHGWRVR